jgi:hypothetical protein
MPSGTEDLWERRVALTQVNGRRVNESIDRAADAEERVPVFVCECGRVGCTTTIEVGREDYERARATFERFVVAPGHELLEVEDVVERHPGYLIVEKRGVAAEVAAGRDPGTESDAADDR